MNCGPLGPLKNYDFELVSYSSIAGVPNAFTTTFSGSSLSLNEISLFPGNWTFVALRNFTLSNPIFVTVQWPSFSSISVSLPPIFSTTGFTAWSRQPQIVVRTSAITSSAPPLYVWECDGQAPLYDDSIFAIPLTGLLKTPSKFTESRLISTQSDLTGTTITYSFFDLRVLQTTGPGPFYFCYGFPDINYFVRDSNPFVQSGLDDLQLSLVLPTIPVMTQSTPFTIAPLLQINSSTAPASSFTYAATATVLSSCNCVVFTKDSSTAAISLFGLASFPNVQLRSPVASACFSLMFCITPSLCASSSTICLSDTAYGVIIIDKPSAISLSVMQSVSISVFAFSGASPLPFHPVEMKLDSQPLSLLGTETAQLRESKCLTNALGICSLSISLVGGYDGNYTVRAASSTFSLAMSGALPLTISNPVGSVEVTQAAIPNAIRPGDISQLFGSLQKSVIVGDSTSLIAPKLRVLDKFEQPIAGKTISIGILLLYNNTLYPADSYIEFSDDLLTDSNGEIEITNIKFIDTQSA